MLVLYFIHTIFCSKIEKNNIGNKFYYIEYTPQPELKLVRDGSDMILKKVPAPKLQTDPGAIYLEEMEFNVFLFKLDDGYVCKNSDHSNMALNACKTPNEKYTEWAMIKLNEYLQIRTRDRGLCLEKTAPRKSSTTEYSMKVGPCNVTTPFQFTLREIENLNSDVKEGPDFQSSSEKVRKALNRMKKTKRINPYIAGEISRQYLNSTYPVNYYDTGIYPTIYRGYNI